MSEAGHHDTHTTAISIGAALAWSVRHWLEAPHSLSGSGADHENRPGISQLFSDEKGTAAIEFGVIGAFLSLLLLGLVDFGMGYWQEMQVGNAARAGGEYAIIYGWDPSGIETGITTAVTSATGLGSITATPAPTKTYGCASVSAGITTATLGSSCTGGGTAGTYVTVNAQASYSTVFTYPGIANPLTLTASTTVRIQ